MSAPALNNIFAPALNNIFERLLSGQMYEFYNGLLSEFVSAYRKFHSCETFLLRLTENWRMMRDSDEGGLVS